MFHKIISFALIVGVVNCGVAKQKNKLQLKIVKTEECGDNNEIQLDIKINKVDEDTNSYSANATLPYDLGDDISLQVNIDRWDGDNWQEDVYILKRDKMCSFIGDVLGEVFFKMQDRWNMPRNECPMPAGHYEDRDMLLDLEDLEIPKQAAGILKSTTRLYKDGKAIMCRTSTVELW